MNIDYAVMAFAWRRGRQARVWAVLWFLTVYGPIRLRRLVRAWCRLHSPTWELWRLWWQGRLIVYRA